MSLVSKSFACTAAACSLAIASPAWAALYTFEEANQLAENFSGFSNFSQSATGGIDDSGSIALTSTSQVAVENASFDASSGSFAISSFFQYNGANSGGRGFFVGLTSDSTDTYSSSATTTGTDLRVIVTGSGSSDNYGIALINNATTFAGSSLNVPLVTGEWYQLVLNVGPAVGGQFTAISGELLDDDGVSLKNLNNDGLGGYTQTTSLTSDTEAHAFFGGQNPTSRAASNADNFFSPSDVPASDAVIPEPGSLGLLALGSVLMLRRRSQS
ncbi:MAG: PEP-CTERM sorting domain-containing protein [Planctomycetota bacterium]